MVSYGSFQDSIVILRELVINQDVTKVLVLENNPSRAADWNADSKLNENSKEVLSNNKFTVFYANANLGFGPGLRYLFSKVDTEYALIVNPDCSPSEQGIKTLFNHILNCTCAVVSGILEKPNGDIDTRRPFMILPIAKTVMTAKSTYSNFLLKSYFPGALALFDVKKLMASGNYSKLFMYFDEIDTLYKLERQGFSSHSIDVVVGIHSRGLTTLDKYNKKSKFTAYWSTRSTLIFTRCNAPIFLPTVMLARLLWGAYLFFTGNYKLTISVFRALFESVAARVRTRY